MIADIDSARSGRIRVDGAYYESDSLKTIPGVRWHARGDDYWSIPLELPPLYALVATFNGNVQMTEELAAWCTERFANLVIPVRMLKKSLVSLPDGYEPPSSLNAFRKSLEPAGLALRKFQEVAAVMLPLVKQVLLADDLGAGKTVEAIASLVVAGDACPALIIVPNSVLHGWVDFFHEWAPWFDVTVLEGKPAERRKLIAYFEKNLSENSVMLVSYDIAKTHSRAASYGNHALKRCEKCGGSPGEVTEARCEAHEKELNRIDWQTVILDEAHRITDPTTTQTRMAWGVSRGAKYRWALTGTPYEKNPAQLWPILHFLNPTEWPSSVAYRDRYCHQVPNPWGGVDVLGLEPSRTVEFHKATEHRILRRAKTLILPELPPKVYLQRHVELSAKERKSYNEMREKLITQLDSGTLYANSPLVLAGRLFQMSAGLIDVNRLVDGDVNVVFSPGKDKLGVSSLLDEVDALVLEVAPEPLVIYFVNVGLLQHCHARLLKKGHHVSVVYGDVPPAARTEAVKDFQEGRTNIFLATYGAGSEGITLTRASIMARPQLPWSSLQYSQSEDRLHRIGAEVHESITYVDFYVKDTIAEHIPELHVKKKGNLQEVLQDEATLRRLLG